MRSALLALCLMATKLGAQPDSPAPPPRLPPPPPKALCYRAHDASRCRSYLITDLSVGTALFTTSTTATNGAATTSVDDYTGYFEVAIGWARNTSPRSSLGLAAGFLGADGSGPSSIEMRHRRWGTGRTSWEFSGGYARAQIEGFRPCATAGSCLVYVNAHGVRAGATYVIGPFLNAFVRGQLTTGEDDVQGAVFAGASATSAAGPIALGAILVLAIAALSAAY